MSLLKVLRTPLGIWLLMRSVSRPSVASTKARMDRGSSVMAARRWLVMSSDTTWAALSKACAAAAALPWRISAAMLSGASAHTTGAPAAMASARHTTIGRSSYSTTTASAASRACCSVFASTTATASPTNRARSTASAWRSGLAPGAPPARPKPVLQGIGFMPAATRSAPQYTAATPCAASAADLSTETMRACGYGERTKHTRNSPA